MHVARASDPSVPKKLFLARYQVVVRVYRSVQGPIHVYVMQSLFLYCLLYGRGQCTCLIQYLGQCKFHIIMQVVLCSGSAAYAFPHEDVSKV